LKIHYRIFIANVAGDYVTDELFDDNTIKTTEKNLVGIALGAGSAIAGGKYLSGLPSSSWVYLE
jgi:hypothetical protein